MILLKLQIFMSDVISVGFAIAAKIYKNKILNF